MTTYKTVSTLAVVASQICEIPHNSLKIRLIAVQGHPRLSILVSIESACVNSYYLLIVTLNVNLLWPFSTSWRS